MQNTDLKKVSVNIGKEFDSKTTYKKEFLETKIKFHGEEVTDFYDKNILNVDSFSRLNVDCSQKR